MKLDLYLTLLMKINSKWIKELNVRPETVKILEENIGENSLPLDLAMTPKTQAAKTKQNKKKWDYIKLKSSLHQSKPSAK